MDWLTDGVATAIGVIVTAMCSLAVAFVRRRPKDETDPENPPVMQGQPVHDADGLADYLSKVRVPELEAEVATERAAKEAAWRQRDAAYNLLRQHHIPVPDPNL